MMLNVAFIQKKYAYYNCTKIGDGQSIGDDNNYRAVPSTTPLDSTRLDWTAISAIIAATTTATWNYEKKLT